MRVVRNDGFIKKRIRFTQRGSLLGMGLLLVSLILSTRNQYELTLAAWLLLLVGFVVAMVAVQVGNRYVRPPRPDTVLDKLLKGLDSRFVAYHYLYPAEHLLLTPGGLVAVQMQGQRGRVSVRGKRWHHGPFLQRLRVLLGESPLGNPAAELRRTLAATARAVADLGEQVANLPLEGIIVFYADGVQLTAEDPEYPVVTAEELKARLREMADRHPALSSRSHKTVAATLAGQAPLEEESEPAAEPAQAPKAGKGRRRGKPKKG